jgi:hypothetical protein
MRPAVSSQFVAPAAGEAVAPGSGDLNNGEPVDVGRRVPAGRGVRVAWRVGAGKVVGVDRVASVAFGVAITAARVGGAGSVGIAVHADANATITTSREKTSAIWNGAGR